MDERNVIDRNDVIKELQAIIDSCDDYESIIDKLTDYMEEIKPYKNYTVQCKETRVVEISVEARDEDEARDKAEEAYDDNEIPDEDWEIEDHEFDEPIERDV